MTPSDGGAGVPGARPASRLWWTLLVGAVLVQCVVLYAPSGPGTSPFPDADKVVHVLVFLVPVAVALGVGVARWAVVTLFAGHAVVSELVQASLLPGRSGDWRDVVADLVGIGLGVAVWWLAGGSGRWSGGRRAAGRLVVPPR